MLRPSPKNNHERRVLSIICLIESEQRAREGNPEIPGRGGISAKRMRSMHRARRLQEWALSSWQETIDVMVERGDLVAYSARPLPFGRASTSYVFSDGFSAELAAETFNP